jgi:hypothetical protein
MGIYIEKRGASKTDCNLIPTKTFLEILEVLEMT